nr:putative reverse transcriptase domain-containing protein [Tanacetum cinerariifolium]
MRELEEEWIMKKEMRMISKDEVAPNRRSGPSNDENPDIAAIIAQQLQNILPQIVTQVTNNVNNANANGGNGNGRNNGCSYKAFLACNPRDYDRKGGAVKARGLKASMEMTWVQFKALLMEEFCPSNEMEKLEIPHLVTPESKHISRYINGLAPQIRGMLRATQPIMIQSAILMAGILIDEVVCCGNEKEKVGKGFVATTAPRNKNVGSYPKCAKCSAYHPEGGLCRLYYNCQKLGQFARDCQEPVRQVVSVSAVRMENNQRLSKNKVEIVCHGKVVRIPLEGDETKEDQKVYLKLVLELLKKERLYAKFSKCEFWLLEVHFLSHVVNRNGIHVDPSKFEAVNNWKAPIVPKTRSMSGGVRQEEAFQTLKDNLCNAPILTLPGGIEDFVVYFEDHEKNYTTHDLELGAVVFALKTWRHYLYGTKSVIYTDHKSIQHIFNQKELNMRQRRWIEFFSDYECEIRYHPGKANVAANAFCRKERVKPRHVRAMAMTI